MPKYIIKLTIGSPHVDQEYQSIKLANQAIAGELSYAIRTLAHASKSMAAKKAPAKKASAKKVTQAKGNAKTIQRPKKGPSARSAGPIGVVAGK
jgi:hypothetical protein